MKKPIIFTIGHSTHPIEEFIELLHTYGIQEVVDVRTIPMSGYNPQFNKDVLDKSLKKAGIKYRHLEKLGGLRHTVKDSQNLGWRNKSFRGFADYMSTPEFEEGLETLVDIASSEVSAIMCAVAVPWRCHRSLIGDALTKKGWLVKDIMSKNKATRHKLTSFLKVKNNQIIYPEPKNDSLPL